MLINFLTDKYFEKNFKNYNGKIVNYMFISKYK